MKGLLDKRSNALVQKTITHRATLGSHASDRKNSVKREGLNRALVT